MVEDYIGFIDIPIGSSPAAVYLLLLNGQVVYAGQSTNVFARVASHYQTLLRKRRGLRPYMNASKNTDIIVFDDVKVRLCAKEDLDRLEFELIERFFPKHNVMMKREMMPSVDLTKCKFFQELMEKGRQAQAEQGIKRRRLPDSVFKVEQGFKETRDARQVVSLPRLKCLELE